jgi:site-specific recombinase XerD
MPRSKSKRYPLKLSQAIDLYNLYADARHLSQHTIDDYNNTFRKFAAHLEEDLILADITPETVMEFLASFDDLTNKTLLNYHTGLSALFEWAYVDGSAPENILHQVPRPKPEQRVIVPYTESEIKALLASVGSSASYTRPGKRACTNQIPTSERARAILLTLLDTGLRVEELCQLTVSSVNFRNRFLIAFGKGAKERQVYFSARTGQAIHKYLVTRSEYTPSDPLFATSNNTHLTRSEVYKFIRRLGERAGVPGCTVHRFRHTFAINYLRNGGDIITLQTLLGHTTPDMTRIYLLIAQSDLASTHRTASPVDHWRL